MAQLRVAEEFGRWLACAPVSMVARELRARGETLENFDLRVEELFVYCDSLLAQSSATRITIEYEDHLR